MASRPILKDVAKLAGVSEMTASRALRRVGDVSKATLERVEAAAAELGYVPNRIAGALASASVDLVGVIFPSMSSFVFPEVLAGISSVLGDGRIQPVVGITDYSLDKEERVVREMLAWRPAGIIIAGLEHNEATTKMLKSAGVPVVEIMDVDGDPIDYCVGISQALAGRDMARAIFERGYHRIGYIGTRLKTDHRAQKRFEGFVAELKTCGLELEGLELYSGPSTIRNGRELTAGLLERHPDLDCIYYSTDVMSVGGYMHCLSKGLNVPGDVAIAGFNDLELLSGLPMRLATTTTQRFETGEIAARVVLDRKAFPQSRIALTPQVITGESL